MQDWLERLMVSSLKKAHLHACHQAAFGIHQVLWVVCRIDGYISLCEGVAEDLCKEPRLCNDHPECAPRHSQCLGCIGMQAYDLRRIGREPCIGA